MKNYRNSSFQLEFTDLDSLQIKYIWYFQWIINNFEKNENFDVVFFVKLTLGGTRKIFLLCGRQEMLKENWILYLYSTIDIPAWIHHFSSKLLKPHVVTDVWNKAAAAVIKFAAHELRWISFVWRLNLFLCHKPNIRKIFWLLIIFFYGSIEVLCRRPNINYWDGLQSLFWLWCRFEHSANTQKVLCGAHLSENVVLLDSFNMRLR